MPESIYEIPPGHDAWVVGDEPWITLEWTSARTFALPAEGPGESMLLSVLFTDIVDSTATLHRVGDVAWRDLLIAHNRLLREDLNTFRGREVATTGDGFLAVFDGATRAVRCGMAMVRSAGTLGLSIRVGVHTGEVEFIGEEARGLAVHAAARVMSLAGPDEVLVSSTTRDLLEGSGVVLEDAGTHELKGLPGVRAVVAGRRDRRMTSSEDRPMTDRFIPPMLATLVREPFDDPAWLYEVKWDGFRVEAVVGDGDVRLWTRGRQDAAGYFGPFLSPATWLDSTDAILDGEVIALDRHGEPDFALLQSQIRRRGVAPEGARVVYQVFDLLWLDGESLLDLPLEERKARLKAVLRDDPRVRYSDHVLGDGIAFFEAARVRRLEGIMAKARDSIYEPGRRGATWLKVKIRPEQELVVVGWTTGKGYAAELGALLVAVYDDGRLRYVGKVGAGFTGDTRTDLLARLAPLAASEPAADGTPTGRLGREARWVRPELVVRAEFAGWTGDGQVRQAAYKGVDFGKDPRKVVREAPPS